MPNGTYGGVRGKETKVGQKTFVSRPTRFYTHPIPVPPRTSTSMDAQWGASGGRLFATAGGSAEGTRLSITAGASPQNECIPHHELRSCDVARVAKTTSQLCSSSTQECPSAGFTRGYEQ